MEGMSFIVMVPTLWNLFFKNEQSDFIIVLKVSFLSLRYYSSSVLCTVVVITLFMEL